MTDGIVSSLRNIARMRKMTSGIFVDAADALEEKDKRIAQLEAALDHAMKALIEAKISDPSIRDAILGKLVWQ